MSGIFDPAIFDAAIFDVEAAAVAVFVPGYGALITPEDKPLRRRYLELFDLDPDLYAARLVRAA